MAKQLSTPKPWHLYVIRTEDEYLYAGITTDVIRRFNEHRNRGKKAAKFFNSRAASELVFQLEIGSHALALRVERFFKHLPKRQKEHIVENGKLQFDSLTGQIY